MPQGLVEKFPFSSLKEQNPKVGFCSCCIQPPPFPGTSGINTHGGGGEGQAFQSQNSDKWSFSKAHTPPTHPKKSGWSLMGYWAGLLFFDCRLTTTSENKTWKREPGTKRWLVSNSAHICPTEQTFPSQAPNEKAGSQKDLWKCVSQQ